MHQSQAVICLLVISSIIMMVPSGSKVFAAVISCAITKPCVGTNDDDVINGSKEGDSIRGLDGNDILKGGQGNEGAILGGDGDDQIYGGPGDDDELAGQNGNDFIDGGIGNDPTITGGPGDDVIKGGPGDDHISHGTGFTADVVMTDSDGGQDKIDCGSGNDEVWINVSTDHDTVKNCETVHTESDK